MRYIRVWCEWDVGQEYLLFHTEDDAKVWLERQMRSLWEDFDDEFSNGISDVFDEGLASFYIADVWMP